jgi:hypothetical protein
MTPMRASIVGPPRVATSIRASIASCHWRGMLGFGKLGDVVAGVLEGDEPAPARQVDRLVEWAFPTLSHH